MSCRAFDRPDLDQYQRVPPLRVTGSFPTAVPSAAYEGRLRIRDAIGACTVVQVDGAILPLGAALYVDNATSEVVLTWPAYQETGVIPIAGGNGGFEAGDTGWAKGAGWSIDTRASQGQGFGTYVGTYRGQGESFMEGQAFAPTFPGQMFAGQVNVQQGASSRRNVGAGIGMRFYDRERNLLATQLGTFIDDGSGGAWHMSTGSFQAPAEAWLVRPVIRANRTRQNYPLWVDDAAWTLQGTVGINYMTTLCMTLRVRDSDGRVADWTGCVVIGNPSAGITAAIRHWWNMDEESSAAVLADQTGNAPLTLVNKGSATFRGAPIRTGGGASIRFTGTAAASSSYFPGWITQTDDYAVAAWVVLDSASASARRTIIGDAPAVDGAGSMPLNYRVNVNIAPAGEGEAFWEHGDGIDDALLCTGAIGAGQPVLLVVSRDAETGEVIGHVNGVRVASPHFLNPPQGGGDQTKRLTVGNVQSLDQPFLGYLQDIAVFDRPLTDIEVEWLYNAGAGRSYDDVTSGNVVPTERIKITVPAQAEALTGFPMYVDLSDLPGDVWDGFAFRDGRDIRAKTATGTDIPFHLVRVDPGARAGAMFVRLDLSATAATEFFLSYGDPGAGRVPSNAPNGANAVWADYHRVHLFHIQRKDETGSGAEILGFGRTRAFELVSEETGLTEHQGICWDGTHYYVVDTNALHKYDSAWNLVGSNNDPVGDVGNGTNHCGDPDVHDGIVYVPVESYTSVTVFSNQRIARFRASDLTFIDSVDVSAQGDEVSTVSVDAERNTLWATRYSDSTTHRINGYDLKTLAYIGSSANTPGTMRVQGMKRWRDMWFVNGDTNDRTFLISEDLGSATRQWTDIADNASTRSGNYEGLGATDDELLVLRDDGSSSVVHTIRPLNAEAGGGIEMVSSPDGTAYMRSNGLTNQSTFTMGATFIGNSFGAANQALLSFSASTTANNQRVTLGCRSTGKIGLWDTSNTWLESTTDPAAGTKYRAHARYSGSASRSLFVNGVREAHATSITQAPSGKVVLFIGVEDLSLAEPFVGQLGFVYLRASALSDAWIAAECANLASPGAFYTVDGS